MCVSFASCRASWKGNEQIFTWFSNVNIVVVVAAVSNWDSGWMRTTNNTIQYVNGKHPTEHSQL